MSKIRRKWFGMLSNLFLFSAVVSVCTSVPVQPQKEYKVGCVRCNPVETKRLNVHLVPHSHDDVGWLKTVHQYYYGERNDIQKASVKNIIDTTVDALAKNPERKFIQVETAFFWEWWSTQMNDSRRLLFKKLVDNGQVEMVNGAWSMNDEACTNYQSTIDQFTLGLRVLSETIGECAIPTVGWQIDPFGHSREHASLLSQMGYDGVFFSRLHADDKLSRESRGALDLAWQGSVNLDDSVIFTGIFPTGSYYPPKGHCYDDLCNDANITDDKKSVNYNLGSKIEALKDQVTEWAKYYPTNNVLVTMGGDFQYQNAEVNFENMDKLIKGMKDDPDLNIFYSTPACYIQAVHSANPILELHTEDFFPYREDKRTYWTGYFTSRPNSKRFERMGHSILQATKQLSALATIASGKKYDENLRKLAEIMGIMQHHDAITGTEQQHVTDDYVKLLTEGVRNAEKPMGEFLTHILKKGKRNDIFSEISSCLLANVSICTVSQSADTFLVVVYNPLSWTTTHYVRLPVEDASYKIVGPNGTEKYDLIPSLVSVFDPLIPDKKSSKFDLVFAARHLPPMGLKVYHITRGPTTNDRPSDDKFQDTAFHIDPYTNLLKSVTLNGIKLDVTQNFYYYKPETNWPASGAYLFRPEQPDPVKLIAVEKINEYRGELVHEFQQKWKTDEFDLAQTIRWYKHENYVEFDWIVGRLDKSSEGREVISRFDIRDFDNEGTFYTDSNGREMISRKKGKNPGFEDRARTEQPVTSNYYPVTSQILIRDERRDLSVALLNDRPQGGSSLASGQIELMVHRRLLHDDVKGVGEPLDEKEYDRGVYVRGSHYLVLGKANTANPNGKTTAAQARILAQKKLLQPWVGLTKTALSVEELHKEINTKYTALTRPLPSNVNILTLEPWTDKSFILRLEHIMEKEDDPDLSDPVEIDLKEIFQAFQITKSTEMTLAANQKLSDRRTKDAYIWNLNAEKKETIATSGDTSATKISLTPMRIRTFEVEFGPPTLPKIIKQTNTEDDLQTDWMKVVETHQVESLEPEPEEPVDSHFRPELKIWLPINMIKKNLAQSSTIVRDTYFVLLMVLAVAAMFIWSFKW